MGENMIAQEISVLNRCDFVLANVTLRAKSPTGEVADSVDLGPVDVGSRVVGSCEVPAEGSFTVDAEMWVKGKAVPSRTFQGALPRTGSPARLVLTLENKSFSTTAWWTEAIWSVPEQSTE